MAQRAVKPVVNPLNESAVPLMVVPNDSMTRPFEVLEVDLCDAPSGLIPSSLDSAAAQSQEINSRILRGNRDGVNIIAEDQYAASFSTSHGMQLSNLIDRKLQQSNYDRAKYDLTVSSGNAAFVDSYDQKTASAPPVQYSMYPSTSMTASAPTASASVSSGSHRSQGYVIPDYKSMYDDGYKPVEYKSVYDP